MTAYLVVDDGRWWWFEGTAASQNVSIWPSTGGWTQKSTDRVHLQGKIRWYVREWGRNVTTQRNVNKTLKQNLPETRQIHFIRRWWQHAASSRHQTTLCVFIVLIMRTSVVEVTYGTFNGIVSRPKSKLWNLAALFTFNPRYSLHMSNLCLLSDERRGNVSYIKSSSQLYSSIFLWQHNILLFSFHFSCTHLPSNYMCLQMFPGGPDGSKSVLGSWKNVSSFLLYLSRRAFFLFFLCRNLIFCSFPSSFCDTGAVWTCIRSDLGISGPICSHPSSIPHIPPAILDLSFSL